MEFVRTGGHDFRTQIFVSGSVHRAAPCSRETRRKRLIGILERVGYSRKLQDVSISSAGRGRSLTGILQRKPRAGFRRIGLCRQFRSEKMGGGFQEAEGGLTLRPPLAYRGGEMVAGESPTVHNL